MNAFRTFPLHGPKSDLDRTGFVEKLGGEADKSLIRAMPLGHKRAE
jgi:hypothetical protein